MNTTRFVNVLRTKISHAGIFFFDFFSALFMCGSRKQMKLAVLERSFALHLRNCAPLLLIVVCCVVVLLICLRGPKYDQEAEGLP